MNDTMTLPEPPQEHERLSQEEIQRRNVRQEIAENAAFSRVYVIMNALATVVACYGLLQDSAAVVIGAMIIAMLLGPIAGIALALVDGDMALLRRAALAEVGGVLLVLGIAFILGKIHRTLPLTQELLARTTPNILDLMIALAGGAAGAYATVSPRLSASLVGVAIATALVPPLAACGLCLARGETRLAFGSFLLFFTNFVAIQFASSVVMFLNGYHRVIRRPEDRNLLYRQNAFSLVILLILTAALSVNFSRNIDKQQYETKLREHLEKALKPFPGVRLSDVRFEQTDDKEVVFATVITPYSLSPQRVGIVEDALPKPSQGRLELHIRSIIAKETTRNGYLHELPPTPDVNQADKVGQ